MPTIILSRINAVFYYYERLLLTGSEYTYRQTMGHRSGGMLISTDLGWVSSRVSTNESIWGGPKTAAALTWSAHNFISGK